MPSDKQKYAAALRDTIDRYGQVETATARAIAELLRRTRQEITDSVGDASASGQVQLGALRSNIDAILADFDATAAAGLERSIRDAFTLGGASAMNPLQAIGVPGAAFWQPSASTLNLLVDFSADLVTGITSDVRGAVNRQVQLVALQQVSPSQAMRNLSQTFGSFGVQQGKQVATGITAKSERVIRTELSRVFNSGNHSQLQDAAESGRVVGLLKRWIATPDTKTRKSHIRIHNETRKQPIPWDKPYILKTKGKPPAALMYPGDPSGPAHEIIQCRCSQVSVHPAVGAIGSPLDGQIAAELKRRGE